MLGTPIYFWLMWYSTVVRRRAVRVGWRSLHTREEVEEEVAHRVQEGARVRLLLRWAQEEGAGLVEQEEIQRSPRRVFPLGLAVGAAGVEGCW